MKDKLKVIISILFIIFVTLIIIGIIYIIATSQKNEVSEEIPAISIYNNIEKFSTYDNPIVPDGFKKIETETSSWEIENGITKGWNNGLVIEDEIGNQFVWVPNKYDINLSNYTIIDNYIYGTPGTNYSEKELLQLLKYGGFYISRYEAGLPKEISENTQTFSSETNNKKGKPISQKDAIVWNFIDWDNAKINAQNMYNTAKLNSDLITYSQWALVTSWLGYYASEDSNEYGNYSNSNFTFSGYYSIDYGKTYHYGKDKVKDIYNMILSAGASERNKTKNIYDLAGNVSEFIDTYKVKYSNETLHTVHYCQGGNYDFISTYGSISSHMTISNSNSRQGFRIVLYQQ